VLEAVKWVAGEALLIRARGRRVVVDSLVGHMAEAMKEYDEEHDADK
jgi:hypothetical protein